jgi:aspartyl-tRNA synthetase
MKRSWAGTLDASRVGDRVVVKGWVQRRRDHGGVVFLNLRDRSGVVQLVAHGGERPGVDEAIGPVRVEWVVEAEGTVAARAPEAVNREMATGEVEVVLERLVVLARSEPPPVSPESKVEASEETRLRYRYLDLRSPRLQRNLMLRHEVTLEIQKYLSAQGFVHLETPILTRSTPEGARDYLVPSRVHRGSFFALPQSPQLFKQLFMVAGLERYVQIARCFRDEDLRADRQPEFTQVDIEMSFIEEEDVFELIEGLFAHIFPRVGIEVATPFPRLDWSEAMRRFGSDRPDTRFGLEIEDLTDLLGESGFRGFRSTVEAGGVIRAITVPGAAGASRKQVDGWADLARRHGAMGVLTLRRSDGETLFQVKNALETGELEAAAGRLALAEGGLALLVAADEPVAARALGALRVALAREHGLVPAGRHEFLWVRDFPLVEWSEEEGRWQGTHHPFTAPDPRDVDRLESDPGSVRSRSYDVVLDGNELGGGSIRIHDAAMQQRVFDVLGIDAEEARARFGFFLDALRYGAPPHGGIALGLDRIVMLMAGAESLRDVIAFPKTTSSFCMMTEAPSAVDERQLRELGLSLVSGGGTRTPED